MSGTKQGGLSIKSNVSLAFKVIAGVILSYLLAFSECHTPIIPTHLYSIGEKL